MLVLMLIGLVFFTKQDSPVFSPSPNPPPPGADGTSLGLTVADGFKLEIYASDLPGVRDITMDNQGNLWASQTTEGQIVKFTENNGVLAQKLVMLTGLQAPHGLAFGIEDQNTLYYAEENAVSKVNLDNLNARTKLADLPTGGRHGTRTIAFGPDGRLYVSIGSSCDVCVEEDNRRAKIFSLRADGSDWREEARGLRNTVFFTWSEVDGRMWGTDMGSDDLGDDLPPDEINIIERGKNYGWPNCYGNNIHNSEFDKNIYIRNPCMEPFETSPHVKLPAHSAVLGLDFVPEEGWPENYWYDLIVALHGSSQRTELTGYKLIRVKLDQDGNYQGVEDFVTGWLKGEEVSGRPVDVYTQPGGTTYVSDDKIGVIYKISYQQQQ